MKKKFFSLFLTSLLILSFTGCDFTKSVRQIFTGSKFDFSDSNLNLDREKRKKDKPMGKKGTWTTFVYLCGSDLESNLGMASKDFEEMISSSANENTKFVVETGGAKSWKNDVFDKKIQRYVIEDGKADLADEQAYENMGDSKTLTDFLKWGIENYAAANMGLVFWDHGGGSIQGVCLDEKSSDYDRLFLREIDAALYSVYDDMTDKFTYVGFDACLMGSVEMAALLASHADYMIASEESEPGYGWNYTEIGNYLSENPNADGKEIGKEICDS